jgi:bacteriorhodopsin
MNVVYATLWISIFLQIFTGVLDVVALLQPFEPQLQLIRHLLVGELAVQCIEASFYVYWAAHFSNIQNITPKRYADWMVTTPTMLITLILYSIYLGHKEQNKDTSTLYAMDLLRTHWVTISQVVGLNALMLGLGYLGERQLLSVPLAVGLGFIPFLIYYGIIYINFSVQSQEGVSIFYYFFIFWSLYGVAALLPYSTKNAMYNILDIFAKNFFGLFLVYVIYKN